MKGIAGVYCRPARAAAGSRRLRHSC